MNVTPAYYLCIVPVLQLSSRILPRIRGASLRQTKIIMISYATLRPVGIHLTKSAWKSVLNHFRAGLVSISPASKSTLIVLK